MFSTMITELSTMIPKSTAPIDSRLADFPCRYRTVIANSRASGITRATIPALARSPRKTNRTAITSAMPTIRLCSTLCVVTWTRSVRWLKTPSFIPLGRSSSRSISRIFSATASATGSDFSYLRIRTIPSTTSSSSPRPTIPSRGWWPTTTWATWRT